MDGPNRVADTQFETAEGKKYLLLTNLVGSTTSGHYRPIKREENPQNAVLSLLPIIVYTATKAEVKNDFERNPLKEERQDVLMSYAKLSFRHNLNAHPNNKTREDFTKSCKEMIEALDIDESRIEEIGVTESYETINTISYFAFIYTAMMKFLKNIFSFGQGTSNSDANSAADVELHDLAEAEAANADVNRNQLGVPSHTERIMKFLKNISSFGQGTSNSDANSAANVVANPAVSRNVVSRNQLNAPYICHTEKRNEDGDDVVLSLSRITLEEMSIYIFQSGNATYRTFSKIVLKTDSSFEKSKALHEILNDRFTIPCLSYSTETRRMAPFTLVIKWLNLIQNLSSSEVMKKVYQSTFENLSRISFPARETTTAINSGQKRINQNQIYFSKMVKAIETKVASENYSYLLADSMLRIQVSTLESSRCLEEIRDFYNSRFNFFHILTILFNVFGLIESILAICGVPKTNGRKFQAWLTSFIDKVFPPQQSNSDSLSNDQKRKLKVMVQSMITKSLSTFCTGLAKIITPILRVSPYIWMVFFFLVLVVFGRGHIKQIDNV